MKKTVLHAAILSLTMPMSLYGLGLGDMVVKSALDQPFMAEIELIDLGSNSLATIKINVADPQQFEEIGLERAAILSYLKFKIGKNSQGKNVIIVTSDERMTEPYMELVIDLAWPNGQLYKTYTVLLDPPGYQLGETIAQSKPSYYKKKDSGYTGVPGVVDKQVISTVDHNPVSMNDNKKRATYGPTIANENVWQIAQRYKTSDLILPQVVLAIVGANPDAFTNGNLNGLKVGAQLAIPATDEIEKVPSDLAVEEVMAHDKAWTEKVDINHVLAPPYINGQSLNTLTQPKNSEIPAIPKANGQTPSFKDSFPQIMQSMAANPLNTATQQPQPAIVSQQAEQDAKTKAEISITTAAVETVRESNAILMEQLHLLQDQNKKLQDKLDQREKELDKMRLQIQTIIKERQALASQASSDKISDDSMTIWPYALLLILMGGGGYGLAYWYFRLRQNKANTTQPKEKEVNTSNSNEESEVLQPHDGSNVVEAVSSIVEQGALESAESTTKEEPAESTTKEEPAESTTKKEPAESTAKEEPAESTAKEEPAESTAKEEPAESTAKEEPAEFTPKEEPTDNTISAGSIPEENDSVSEKAQTAVVEKEARTVEKERPVSQDSTVKSSTKHPRPLASIIAEKSQEEAVHKFEEIIHSESEEDVNEELEFEPETEERAQSPDQVNLQGIEEKNSIKVESNPIIQEDQSIPNEMKRKESPVNEQIEREPLVSAESTIEQQTEVKQEEFIQFESSSDLAEHNDIQAGEAEVQPEIEPENNNRSGESETSEELGALEFESGLHELVKEEMPKPKKALEDTNEDTSMNIEFVSPLEIEKDTALLGDKKDEVIQSEEIELPDDFISLTDDTNTGTSEIDLTATSDESKATEFNLSLEDSSEKSQTNPTEEDDSSSSEKAEIPVKSKKALDTLLDLAKTYISMGDVESARSSLEEVMAHGTTAQKKEAKKILKEL